MLFYLRRVQKTYYECARGGLGFERFRVSGLGFRVSGLGPGGGVGVVGFRGWRVGVYGLQG